MPNDKKLKRLEALLDSFDSGAVQPDELIQAVEAIVAIISNERERLDKVIADNKNLDKQEKSDLYSTVTQRLEAKERELRTLITSLSGQVDGAISQTATRLSKDIKRVEAKIPTKTDLSALEADIQALRDGLNNLPTEFTLNNEAVRDGLELLQGDERLDVSAVKGLDERDGKLSDSLTSQAISIVDNRTSFLINKVNNLQAQIDAGGGMNQEALVGTIDGVNTSFTATVAPKFIITDTGMYVNEATMQNPGIAGFTLSGLNVTLPLGPNFFAIAFY
jgi:hypothetical protein